MTDFSDLANPQRRAIDLIREVAIEKGARPCLVGGPVRDLLLGRHSIDIDITIEDDSSTLARALAKRVGGRIKSFPQFLTYKVIADDLPEIDIATARKERYRAPGALPNVTPGKLKDDLLRRDFSINAIALEVVNGSFHDPTGGESDLRAQLVRILHDRSFVDDPTRVFRAIRLAVRLGFEIEANTRTLMDEAIAGGALSTVSRERIWRELFLAMDEETAPAVLVAMMERGALDVLFGRRREVHRERLDAARAIVEARPELDRYAVYTATLLHGDASPIELEGSGFSQKRARNVVQLANELPHFTDALRSAATERQRLRLLRKASPEMLEMLAIDPGQLPHVSRFREFEAFTLAIRGNELEVEAGPHIARALERTREAVFTGEIEPAGARDFARELAIKYLGRETATEPK